MTLTLPARPENARTLFPVPDMERLNRYRGYNVSPEQVRTLALSKWIAAGRPPGEAEIYWECAERELLADCD